MRRWSLLPVLMATTTLAAQDLSQQVSAAAKLANRAHYNQLDRNAKRQWSTAMRTKRTAEWNRRRAIQKAEWAARREAQRKAQAIRAAERKIITEARNYRRIVVQPAAVRPAVAKLTKKLAWHDDLAAAQRESQRTGKPIFWVHALGDLRGVL